jgi:hypothetical protein
MHLNTKIYREGLCIKATLIERRGKMQGNTLVKSSFSATINASIEKVDIPSWCFTLLNSEYQSCSPAHNACGATTASDGQHMSINVEIPSASLMVQQYIEEKGDCHESY